MSKRERPTSGQKKQRTAQKQERAEQWRATGAALNSGNQRTTALDRSRMLMAGAIDGDGDALLAKIKADPRHDPFSELGNEAYGLLRLLAFMTKHPAFDAAADAMVELGIDGPNFIRDVLRPHIADVASNAPMIGLDKFVREMRPLVASERDLAERVAVKFAIPSSDFDGARQIAAKHIRELRKKQTR